MPFDRAHPSLSLAAIALLCTSGAPGPGAKDDGVCEAGDVEYAVSADLRIRGTTLGAGDGDHPVGPGKLVLRFEGRLDGDATVALVGYELRQRFSVSSKVLLWGARVDADVVTRGPADGSPIAEGKLERGIVHWRAPPHGLHSDGTVTCDGAMCGKFGAPPAGPSDFHLALTAATLESFTLRDGGKELSMPFSRMSKTEFPRQETFVSLEGRERSRSCPAPP